MGVEMEFRIIPCKIVPFLGDKTVTPDVHVEFAGAEP